MRTLLLALTLFVLVGVGAGGAATNPPQNTTSPTTSGVARQGETLTADPGTWSGTQPLTFAFQWRRCDSNGASCANIIGATGKTYTLSSVDVGNRLRMRVRASNQAGSSAVVSAPTDVVAAKAPKSISLDASQSLTVYGQAVTLTSSLANGQAGETVTIEQHPLPTMRTVQVRDVATVQTASDGSFSATVRPSIHMLYRATAGQTSSNAVSIQVRPRLSLMHMAPHRFLVRAQAARSFVGNYGLVQRWSSPRQHWVTLRRVFFTRAFTGVSPTVTSSATFRARPGAVKIRVFLPRGQAAPGYLAGFSNSATA